MAGVCGGIAEWLG
ncbi:MAG: hypothetical protein L0K84_10250 [Acidipropionibacterium jensenii]|nr:hypothetical protein [Acidipropionibacterium jensenii]